MPDEVADERNHRTQRLSMTALDALRRNPASAVELPAFDPGDLGIGIVHLGLGAFHRAHQSVYTELATKLTGDLGWGIAGVTQRTARVVEQLQPQDGLYGVMTLGTNERHLRVVGSERMALFPGRDTEHVLMLLAAPSTHIVSLTITEKGYGRRPDGHVDLSRHGIQTDLTQAREALRAGSPDASLASRTALGLLLRGLVMRFQRGATPLSIISCDNLVSNGKVLRSCLLELSRELGPAEPAADRFVTWLSSSVTFPSTMVDRIVPATTTTHRQTARGLLGYSDAGLVVAEPFSQWVIEDNFAGSRPAWDRVGATLTDDVSPYEEAKLRLLNASHSATAYLGALRGRETIADALADPVVAGIVAELMESDLLPTLTAPPGVDLAAYGEEVISRFSNPHTGHTTVQVAMDGSTKLPQRLLGAVRERLAEGVVPQGAAMAIAAWCLYVREAGSGSLHVAGQPVTLDDPEADRLVEAATGPLTGMADRMLDLGFIFDPPVGSHAGLRRAVRSGIKELSKLTSATRL